MAYRAKTPPPVAGKVLCPSCFFGRSAIEGGLLMFTLGLVIHFAILFPDQQPAFLFYPRWPAISATGRSPEPFSGMAAGITWQFVLAPCFTGPRPRQDQKDICSPVGRAGTFTIGWPLSFQCATLSKNKVFPHHWADPLTTEKGSWCQPHRPHSRPK